MLTIVKPAKSSLTKSDILIGSSKLPSVTAFTARRDYTGSVSTSAYEDDNS